MRSYEVLREAIKPVGAKYVAHELHLGERIIHTWQEEPPSEDSPYGSGKRNPLDTILIIFNLLKNKYPEHAQKIIQWLCNQADGFFIKNPNLNGNLSKAISKALQKGFKEFSEYTNEVIKAWEDGKLTFEEVKRIRKEWEDNKQLGEEFVCSLERSVKRNGK